MAGFGTPLRAGQVLPHGRLQRMQQGDFIQTLTQGRFDGEIQADTDPDPDEGFVRWMRTGRMGTVWWTTAFPSPFDPGDGVYLFTMPFLPDLEYIRQSGTNDYGHRLGDGRIRDNSAGNNSIVVVVQFFIDNVVILAARGSNGSVAADSPFPFGFAQGDAISFRSRYPIDPRAVP